MTVVEEAMERAKTQPGSKPKQVNNMILRVPTIHKVETTATKQEAIDKAVEEARRYIADIPNHMAGLVARIRGIKSASVEEQAIRSKELKDLENEVLEHLNFGEGLLANAARQAYAMAMVKTLPPNKRLVMETIKSDGNSRLPGLLDLKILEPVGDAKNVVAVKVYGDTYKVGGGWDFATKLAENLSDGASRAAKAAHDQYHNAVAALKAQTTISVNEVSTKKAGNFYLNIPDVKEPGKFLPGGSLLAESNGRTIKVIRAIGHFQRIMTEIAEAGTFVSVDSLGHDRLELAKRLSDDKFRQARILHAVLRRGIAAP